MNVLREIKDLYRYFRLSRQLNLFERKFKKVDKKIQKAVKFFNHPDLAEDVTDQEREEISTMAAMTADILDIIERREKRHNSKPKGLCDIFFLVLGLSEWEKNHPGVGGKIKW